jgi:hypothetical protein
LLHGVATHTYHAEHTRLTITSLHAKRSAIQAVLTNLAGFLRTLKPLRSSGLMPPVCVRCSPARSPQSYSQQRTLRTCSSQKLRRHDTLTSVFRMKDELSKWPNNWGEVRSVYKALKIVAYR